MKTTPRTLVVSAGGWITEQPRALQCSQAEEQAASAPARRCEGSRTIADHTSATRGLGPHTAAVPPYHHPNRRTSHPTCQLARLRSHVTGGEPEPETTLDRVRHRPPPIQIDRCADAPTVLELRQSRRGRLEEFTAGGRSVRYRTVRGRRTWTLCGQLQQLDYTTWA